MTGTRGAGPLAEQAEYRLFFRHVVQGGSQAGGVELGEDVVRGP